MSDELLKFDDDIDSFGGDMQAFDHYENFDVENSHKEIKASAKSLVQSLLDMYFKHHKLDEAKYIKAVIQVEEMTISSMLLNLKSGEHLLTTLMRQLDGGAFVNPAVFQEIRETQKHLLDLTLQISKFMRVLPEYFKALVVEYDAQESFELEDAELADDQGNSTQLPSPTSDTPMRGTKELLKALLKESDDFKQEIEARKESGAAYLDNRTDEYIAATDNTQVNNTEEDEDIEDV